LIPRPHTFASFASVVASCHTRWGRVLRGGTRGDVWIWGAWRCSRMLMGGFLSLDMGICRCVSTRGGVQKRHSSKKTFKFPFHQLSSAFISFHQLSSTIQLEEDFQVPLPSRSRPPVPSHPQITRTRPTNPHGARRSCVEENPAGTVEQQHHGFNGRKSLQTKQKDLPPTHRKEVLA
jgi:hypothetical protein